MTTTLSPSAIISRAFEIYRTQVGTLLAGAALIYLAQFVVNLVLPDSLDWIGSIVSLVLTAFFTGMVVMLVRDLQDGHRDSSLGELFSSVTPVFVPGDRRRRSCSASAWRSGSSSSSSRA